MRDAACAEKGGGVRDLYQRRFEGGRLRADEYVICADEKSQLQALGREHACVAAGSGWRRRGSSSTTSATAPSPAWPCWDVGDANRGERVEGKSGKAAMRPTRGAR